MSWRANRLQRRQGIKPDPLRWRPPRRQDRPPNRPPNRPHHNPQPPAPLASQEDNEFDAAIDFLNNVEQQAAPAAEEPTAPVVEEQVAEEPTAPVVEEPVAEEPTAPVVEEPVDPAVEEPAVEEPAAPAAEESVVEEPVVEEPVAEEPVVEEPAVEEPVVEEPVAEEPTVLVAEEQVVEEPTAPAVEEPVAVEEPAAFDEPDVMESTEASVDPALAEQIQLEKTSIVTVGINYFGQSGQLNGCVNDSNNFLSYVQSIVGTRAVTTTQLLDSLANTDPLYPTRANMERVLTEAVQEAWEGKCANILFHYSGHGGSIADTGSDEADQKDEALVPVDFNVNGLITDDWIFENVINALPPNVKFFGLIDACHSGTMFDLRYKVEGNPPQNTLINPSSSEMSTAMLISGCKDAQFSYDVWDAQHGAVGAMTTAWLAQMNADRKRSAYEIVEAMRASLTAQGYPQTPQRSLSKPLEHPVQIFALGEFE